MGGIGPRACPRSAPLSAASRLNPACGDQPGHDDEKAQEICLGRSAALLSTPAPPPLAAAVRSVLETLSELLPAQSGEQTFRPASAPVVRAEPPGRGFRRDVRRLAAAALELAHALCRVAGTQEA